MKYIETNITGLQFSYPGYNSFFEITGVKGKEVFGIQEGRTNTWDLRDTLHNLNANIWKPEGYTNNNYEIY